ncbi:MAG: GMC family oxidoreductase [Desulfatibacillum sp.]|nr:GMC family oxidoreductase [Desulfatibacillum sp.]
MNTSTTQEFDAIIVGSGPGGGTLARELTLRGQKPLVLEWGGNEPLKGSVGQAVDILGTPGKGMLFTTEGLAMARGITTGGGSVVYCGTAFEPDHEMFRRYGVDLAPDTQAARQELPIRKIDAAYMAPQSLLIQKSARDLGYSWENLDKYLVQENCEKGCYRCYYGCPNRAKWSSRWYMEEAVQNGAKLLNRAKATQILMDGDKAVGVAYKKYGKEHKAYAPKVIISAGGIGTPMLLRTAGIKEAGYNFFFDPLFVTVGVVPGLEGTGEMPMAAGVHIKEEGFMMTDMTLHQMMHMAFSAQVLRLGSAVTHRNTMGIMIKAKDALGGEITKRGIVNKRLSKHDKASLNRGFERAKQILKNAGATTVYKTWYIAAHPGGTAKLGEVVDANLQTRHENLYVCDCSVIPEAWGLPPTLAIIAMAKRLSRHLAG